MLHTLLNSRCGTASSYPFYALQRTGRSLEDVFATSTAMSVRLDVQENEKSFLLTADLPGMAEKDIEVSFDDGVLTISGEKKVDRDEEKKTWHITERTSGSFTRKLSVKTPVDTAAIEARFDKGVLSVTLPKLAQETAKSHKIEIKTN